MSETLKFVQEKCKEKGVELVYLTKFGSHLYGTDTENSDTDYKGIFVPSKEQCYLGSTSSNIDLSSGDNKEKNTKEDVDIALWSIQYFLKLVSKGETNALDLLYSPTNHSMIEYMDLRMCDVFANPDKLFDIKDCKAFVGYAIGQAKKYGIKGSRLGVIKRVYELIDRIIYNEQLDVKDLNGHKLDAYISIIKRRCYDKSFCFDKEINGVDSLVIAGKVHQGNISLGDFSRRIEREYRKYGERAKLAEENQGIDWKAISHAVRALDQMKQLIVSGYISYPLENAKHILDVKLGNQDFKVVSKYITETIEEIDSKLNDENFVGHNHKDSKFIKQLILNFYT